jgi:peptidoglycan/LPS O-acetylase OafA/YrhL
MTKYLLYSKHANSINGLRAIAVLAVIGYHFSPLRLSGGYVGVDIFFLISGFLLSSKLLSDHQSQKFSALEFYERRIRRIAPAFFCVLLVTLTLCWWYFLPADMSEYAQTQVASVSLLSNVWFWLNTGYFDITNELKPLLHLWSLSVEGQFYLFLPIIFILLIKLENYRMKIIIGLVLVSYFSGEILFKADKTANFYLIHTRLWEFLVGMLMAELVANGRLPTFGSKMRELLAIFGLMIIFISVIFFNDLTPFPGLLSLAPIMGSCLVIIFADEKNVTGILLRSQIVTIIGLMSYSLYLWHQPIFAISRYRSLKSNIDFPIFAFVLIFIVSYASWRYIENPFRFKKIKSLWIWLGTFILSSLFVAIGLIGVVSQGFAYRIPPDFLPVTYYQLAKKIGYKNIDDQGNLCVSETASVCQISNLPGKNFLLVGDSHSADFSVEFRKLVEGKNYGASQLSVAGCGFVVSHSSRHGGECGNAIALLKKITKEQYFDYLIFIRGDWGMTPQDIAIFNQLIKESSPLVGKIVIFSARYSLNVHPMKAAMLNRFGDIHLQPSSTIENEEINLNPLKKLGNVQIFPQREILIQMGGRGQEFNGHTSKLEPLYKDSTHLTNYGALRVFDQFITLESL